MKFSSRLIACTQIFIHIIFLFIHSFVFSFPVWAETSQPATAQTAASDKAGEDDAGKKLANVLSSAGGTLSQDNKTDALINSAINSGSAYASSEVQTWLQQFGTAKVDLGLNSDLSLGSANLDVLLPLYDDKKQNLIFAQLGGRRDDDRNIINVGVGYRYFADRWMWGVNTFYDQQISDNSHQRLGFGGELGWDYLKLSANAYQRLSGWKDSKEHTDYEERVANGYDVRAEGYLPSYPQLGAQLIWEQYYGDDVALFGDSDDDRQRDPYALTAGINYTPVPLFSIGVNQKMGKGDHNDTQVEMAVNWMLGTALSAQLDADNVKSSRTLLGSRLDLVNRNNAIVLEYRKKELISLKVPEKVAGMEDETLPINVTVKSKYPLDHINWQDDNLVQNGGKITEENGAWTVTLPHYVQNGAEKNMYVVAASAYDNQGNKSDVSHMTVAVSGFNVANITTTTTAASATLPADGVSTTQVSVTVTSGSGQKITGLAESLSAQLIHNTQSQGLATSPVAEKISSFKEQSPGVYVSTFTAGTTPGEVTVQPVYNQTSKLSTTTINLTAVKDTSHFATLDADKTQALANGQDKISLTAHVVDETGNPVQGMVVHWQSDNTEAQLNTQTSTTDSQGNAVAFVTSGQVVQATVSATLDNGESVRSKTLQFTTDVSSARVVQIIADKTVAQADNQDAITLSATVTDASQHPLANQTVGWAIDTASGSAHLIDKESNTDANGIATITLKSAKAGQAIVSASAGGSEALKSDTLSFLPDTKTAMLSEVSASKTSAIANGHDPITFKVSIKDANNNPLKGVPVNWSTSGTGASLSDATTNTNEQGEATVDLTSMAVESATVTAAAGKQSQTSPTINFLTDNATATVQTVTEDKTQAVANQNDRITLTAHVIDAEDHPVANSAVDWNIVEGQGTLSAPQSNTNQQGDATVTLVSSVRGKVIVSASATTGAAVNSSDLLFIADTATAKVSNIVVDKSTAVANGKDQITYTATVTDDKGNPVKDQDVNWTVTPDTANLSAATTKTDVNGTTTTTVTTRKAGVVNVIAKVATSAAWNAPATTFTSDAATAQIENIEASKSTAIANGVDNITFTGTIIDANGNPVAGVNAEWTVSPATGVLSTTQSTSDSAGKITVDLTSTQVENYTVTAKANGVDETSETVSFVVDTGSATIHTLTADKADNTIAAGRDHVTLTATVQDTSGHPIPNATVTWSSDNTTGNFSETSTDTDDNGQAIVTFNGTLAQATTVIASSVNNSRKTIQINIVPDLLSAKVVSINSPGLDYDAAANGEDAIALVATVKDDYGNLVNQENVDWSLNPAGSADLSANAIPTDTKGESTVSVTSHNAVTCKAVATVNGVSVSSGMMRFVADGATAKISRITASKTADIVAGKDVVTLQAWVTDADGNPVDKATVNWGTDSAGGAFKPADSSTTDSSGLTSVTYTDTKAGVALVGAGINHSQETVTLNIIGNAETAALSNINANKTKAVADNTDTVTWSVTVKDANGNVLPAVAVNWSSDDPDLTLVASSSETNEQGIASISGRTLKARDAVVTATIASNSRKLSAAKVTFIGDTKTAVLLSLTVDKTTALANGGDYATYTVDVEDANHNKVPDADISWQTTLNNPSASTTKTNASGVATVKLSGSSVGLATVTAKINASSLSNNSVKFIGTVYDTWFVTTTTSTYNSSAIKGYSDLGFITASPTTGPTSLEWAPSGYADVSTPVTLVSDSGKQYSVNLKGYRTSDCSTRPLNAAVGCASSGGYRARFTWSRDDNPSIPPGHYTGLIHFYGKDWGTSWSFEYRLTMDLTVN